MTMTSHGTKRKRTEDLLSTIDVSSYRRSIWSLDPDEDDLIFQLLECEDASKDKHDGDSSLIRLHGTTETGHSIIVLVRNFQQYLYFPVSSGFDQNDLAGLQEAIELNAKPAVSITAMQVVTRQPLDYYRQDQHKYSKFVKIFVGKPTDVKQVGTILSKSDELPKLLSFFESGKLYSTQTYETNLAYDMRMMTDAGIVGCGWIKVPRREYQKLSNSPPYERVSGVFECQFSAVNGLSPDSTESDEIKTKEFSKLASLRSLILGCIQLDSASPQKSHFPSPSKPKSSKIKATPKSTNTDEPVPFIAMIAMVLTSSPLVYDSADKTILLTFRHSTFSTMKQLPNLEVHCFQSEIAMLTAFRDIFLTWDPDVVSGYDVTSDALPSILSRGLDLGLSKQFVNLARCSHIALKTKRRQIYSGAWIKKERKMAATSNREHTELGCIGRLVLDLRTVIEREERLRTYSLNEATLSITGRPLEKLSETTLLELWNSELKDDNTRIVDYSLAEVEAALEIMRKQASLITYIELSRVTGLNFEDVVSRGQMRRFWSQLFRFCKQRGIVVTGPTRGGEQMTQSALNYMPEVSYDTENPIVVLDFRSLYPSILIARNMCFSTELSAKEQTYKGPAWSGFGGSRFVTSDVKLGVVPQILEHLLTERGRVKTLMKVENDPRARTVLDGRQKAIKVCANAVYGFFGSRESNLQNLAIADGTITEGARLLEQAKQAIEHRYNQEGKTDQVKVVYGDTDSLFVKVFGKSVEEAIGFGKQMSTELSLIWDDPIQLDFEKVLFPSLLQNRKRYAGLLWTNATAPEPIDIKGIEVNRRDAVPLVGELIEGILKILFPARNNSEVLDGACGKISQEQRMQIINDVKDFVRIHVSEILAGDVNIGQFILTKGLWLGTNASDYSAKQTHISVIDKIRSRDSRRMFKDGERIGYVFTQCAPNAKGYEKAEDPVYAVNQKLLLNYQYYLEHTIINPLRRILELLMPVKEIEPLFKPNKSLKTPISKASGVMGAFLASAKKISSRCEICGEQCTDGKLCLKHKDQRDVLREAKLDKLKRLQSLRSERHATCHTCQRSEQRAILCVNMDCDVYFSRTRLDDDTKLAEEELTNFAKAEKLSLDW